MSLRKDTHPGELREEVVSTTEKNIKYSTLVIVIYSPERDPRVKSFAQTEECLVLRFRQDTHTAKLMSTWHRGILDLEDRLIET